MCLICFEFLIQDKDEKEILNAELEGTYALIGKLMTENAELVEKVISVK